MSLTFIQSLRQIEFFDHYDDVEIIEMLESTAAILTRFKIMKQGETYNLIHKDFRPNWVGGGAAELIWYEKYAPLVHTQFCPIFYGGQINREQHQCFLILEDISESHFKMPETWSSVLEPVNFLQTIIDLMLKIHVRWWNQAELKDNTLMHPQGGPLRLAHATTPETLKKYVHTLNQAFPSIVDNLKSTMSSSEWISICEQAIQSWAQLFTRRVAGDKNLTLIHGDFHIWNVFFPHQPQQNQLLAVDWETYKRGLGVYDLAYLLVTCLDPNARREKELDLLRQYHNGLQLVGSIQYSWQECLLDYRLSIITNLFPPLMWNDASKVNQAIVAFMDWECLELIR